MEGGENRARAPAPHTETLKQKQVAFAVEDADAVRNRGVRCPAEEDVPLLAEQHAGAAGPGVQIADGVVGQLPCACRAYISS